MNPMLKDPAAGVPPQLLPHMHLVSKYRYPVMSNPSLEAIVGYLLEAPKIVRDLQPVQWQFIDTPQDGMLMLTWQPLEYLGTSFASDGFVWADAEHVFKSEVRGYRSGYRASGEAMASHSRRRYRLLPGNPNLNLPTPDPSLWLTHYSKASARDHVPSASIPLLPHIQQLLQARRLIQTQGQLPRKEFMLHDRSNWPTIHLPPVMARAAAPGQVPSGAVTHRRGTSIAADTTLEEEEDVSRGDLLDFMTSKEISRLRYEQHHEWMEEVLESPYPTLSIIPSDLGLGRKGPLEELTKDFFDAPISVTNSSGNEPPPRVGKMPDGQAEEFTKRASKKLADMQAELESMRKRHARRMEKLQRSSTLTVAEKKLRTAPNVTERRDPSNAKSDSAPDTGSRDPVEEIVHSVETDTGKQITRSTTVTVMSRGGLQDRVKPTPVTQAPNVPTSAPQEKAANPPTGGTGSSISQPQPPAQVAAPEKKPEANDTSRVPSEQQTSTKSNDTVQPTPSVQQPDPATNENEAVEAAADEGQAGDIPQLDEVGMDVNMDDFGDEAQEQDTNQDGNEWVMIDQEAEQDGGAMNVPDLSADTQPTEDQIGSEQTHNAATAPSTSIQQQEQAEPTQDTGLDTPDFDMGGDFDDVDVDTAGDALASYGDDGDDLNLDNVEDSAFGDAFHPEEDDIS
ncbi:hypothetical protein LTS07_009141 [Exophiala sideris]|uniref:DUF1750-domain-containing protein n=1 Tax=Exophiala sideris TaxID=1016849 RepID=A0ABR0J1L0_9EURO|nr:hypothetical protein LTS07_009141 [Exophiala sideris]KAK5029633.1 hypothetical protein LTR13_008553 [Exophiala sideris]KAK5053422.1 hypothetical protein LTR69_009380 [Exophiala sideris]KAK5179180.1 hypothetical protein LTR44_008334 [Eurotiomycetes sp. CCFEE 6388]